MHRIIQSFLSADLAGHDESVEWAGALTNFWNSFTDGGREEADRQTARGTESLNHLGGKRPLRSPSPRMNLTLPSPCLNHVPKNLIHASFKHLKGW